jgi:hypothetical protein
MPEALVTWSPYVGAAKNARTLSLRLTEKAKIVEQLTGCQLALVQGSPSFSSTSAATHAGPGNAADWSVVDRPAGMTLTAACVAVSAAFRALTVLSYVRGLDVDQNGVKDDSFDWHLHVIDYEDRTVLTPAQADQLADYFAGRDALVGDRPDRETRPATTSTLEQWLTTHEGDLTMANIDDLLTAMRQQNDTLASIDKRLAKLGALESVSDSAATKLASKFAGVKYGDLTIGAAIVDAGRAARQELNRDNA